MLAKSDCIHFIGKEISAKLERRRERYRDVREIGTSKRKGGRMFVESEHPKEWA
jgi:hypothetical protein